VGLCKRALLYSYLYPPYKKRLLYDILWINKNKIK